MALVTPGSLAGQISGRIGSVVYARNRYGSYARNGTVPITSTTPAALAAKAHLQAASTAWQSVSAADRLAWANWAQTNPGTNRLGQVITLTGQAAYVALTSRILHTGQVAPDTPPAAGTPAPLITLTLTGDIGAGAFGAVFAPSPLGAAELLWGYAAVVDSPGINFMGGYWKRVIQSAAAQASPWDFQAALEARVGALQVGQIVHALCGVMSTADGQLSTMLRAKVTVTTT